MEHPVKRPADGWQQQLQQTIYLHLCDPRFSVPFLARRMYSSERHFYRKVKECTDLTPNQYIQQCRMDRAKELLQSGRYQVVKEVCWAVGFKKECYFKTMFRRYFGKMPRAFLREM